MVSKSGFILNGRRQNPTRSAKIFKQDSPLNGPNGLNVMFNASQIPDNPGYMDFNNPTPPISAQNPGNNKRNNHNAIRPQRNMMPPRNSGEHFRNGWGGGRHGRGGTMRSNSSKFGIGNRQFNGVDMPHRPMSVVPPMSMRGPMPHIPIDAMPSHFNGPSSPMMLNNMVGIRSVGRPMPPIPPPMMRRNRNAPPIRRPNGSVSARVMKHRRNNSKPIIPNNTIKSDNPSKKTLKEIINQYPLNKPWVTEEIRVEHAKKEDIENRLKGNKNDELFAAFKVQRDKFVTMYESARDKHVEDPKSKGNDINMTEPDKKTAENKNNQK